MSMIARISGKAAAPGRERRWYVLWLILAMAVLAPLAVPGQKAGKATKKLAEAHAAGHAGGTADYVAYWVPKAAIAGMGTAFLLLLGTRWLVRAIPLQDGPPPFPAPSRKSGWILTGMTAAVMLGSGIANAPRLNYGLWGDEESTMRKTVVGEFERNEAGQLQLDKLTWVDTVFRYRNPNNHPLNSVLARLSHEAFAGDLTRPDGFYFDERAMRLPVFAAGLLGLAAVAWVGWTLGRPGVGGLGVMLLALHPWFTRYGVECRGYGFLLLFMPLAVGCLVRSGVTGHWRWWISYGVVQFLILWSYPGALFLLVALNVSAVAMICCLKGPSRSWRLAQAGRWFTACALGAVLCTLLMLPLVQPLIYYLKSPRMQGPMPAAWYPDAMAWLFTGMPWRAWDAGNPLCWSWQQGFAGRAAAGEQLVIWAGVGWLVLAVAGWWRQGGIPRALLPGVVLTAPFFLIQSQSAGSFVYMWYLMPALPGVILLGSGLAFYPWKKILLPALALVGAFALATGPAHNLLRTHPIEQMREGTKLTRPISLASDPRVDEAMTVDILMTTRGYDPAVLPMTGDDPTLFKKYLAAADAGKKPLFVHFGFAALAEETRPQVMALIRNPGLFEPIAILPGMDGPYTREVHRYRAGALATLMP